MLISLLLKMVFVAHLAKMLCVKKFTQIYRLDTPHDVHQIQWLCATMIGALLEPMMATKQLGLVVFHGKCCTVDTATTTFVSAILSARSAIASFKIA